MLLNLSYIGDVYIHLVAFGMWSTCVCGHVGLVVSFRVDFDNTRSHIFLEKDSIVIGDVEYFNCCLAYSSCTS